MQSGTIMKDSGWSWIVSVGAFVAIMLETGMVKCLGILLPELREQFSTDTCVIGLAISLVPGFGAVTCKHFFYTTMGDYIFSESFHE